MSQQTKINNSIRACLFSVLEYEIIKCKKSNTEQINQIQITKMNETPNNQIFGNLNSYGLFELVLQNSGYICFQQP